MRKVKEQEGEEKYGKEMRDGDETYKSLVDSDVLFAWDWKTIQRVDSDSNGNFLKKLDKMLKPFGLEVVTVDFNGDMGFWCVEKII